EGEVGWSENGLEMRQVPEGENNRLDGGCAEVSELRRTNGEATRTIPLERKIIEDASLPRPNSRKGAWPAQATEHSLEDWTRAAAGIRPDISDFRPMSARL